MTVLNPCLPISKEEFKEWFPEHTHHVYDILLEKPSSEEELIHLFLPSKMWRLNNLYKIVDKYGDKRRFIMNRSQFIVHAASYKHPRLLVLKSRQQGISTFELIDSLDDTIFMGTTKNGLMAQGADEASKLLERITDTWEEFPNYVKNFLSRAVAKDNAKEFSFNNKSSVFIRTSFRSATLQRLHISEYGKIANKYPDRARETKTGTLQTIAQGNRVTIESTAEGHNDFKTMWDNAYALYKSGATLAPKDFYPVFLSWLNDPDCNSEVDQEIDGEAREYFDYLEKELGVTLTRTQKNFWVMQYRELGGDIYQEYPATPEEAFRASKDGTYWSKQYMYHVIRLGNRRSNLWDRNLPVYATIDSGMHDYFVFCFFQVWGKEVRIIGEFFHNNEGLEYYADYLKNEVNPEWNIETIYVPHDFAVRELGAGKNAHGDVKSRQEQWEDMGITNTAIIDRSGKAAGIQLVRSEMKHLYIDDSCEYLDRCMMNYSKKWDKKLLKWSDTDENNEERHGADTIRYMFEVVVNELRPYNGIDEDDYNHSGVAL